MNKLKPTHFEHIFLIGAPNVGKTTVFNWLTGHRSKTVNYAGSTVDFQVGKLLSQYNYDAKVIDTPGLYSLNPKSPEELITYKLLEDPKWQPFKIILCVDSTQMERHLALAQQLMEAGHHFVIALTMTDSLHKKNLKVKTNLLEDHFKTQVISIDGQLGGGIFQLCEVVKNLKMEQKSTKFENIYWSSQHYQDFYNSLSTFIDKIYIPIISFDALVTSGSDETIMPSSATQEISRKHSKTHISHDFLLDKYILHPIWGGVIFFLVMGFFFSSIYWLAQPIMDFIDNQFSTLAQYVLSGQQFPMLREFLGDGLIAGFGAFLVFTPQVFILFYLLKNFEDSGFLSRAATIVDKPLSLIGLNGKSFVPLLSGFACAVPAMMATRNIANKKERALTLFILPLMSCSARLPVYALLIGFLCAGQPAYIAGFCLTFLYFMSLFFGGCAAVILKKFMTEKELSLFAMELPPYRVPKQKIAFYHAFKQTMSFVKRAGPIILILSLVIWFASHYPRSSENQNKQQIFTHSYAADIGHYLEPVFEPMGIDWKAGLGILSSFAAREVFVSTMAMIYGVSEDLNEISIHKSLIKKMKSEKNVYGQPLYSSSSIIALLVFYLIALQCVATVAVSKKEFGNWKMPILQFLIFNGTAYALAVLTYHSLKLFHL